MSCPARRPGRRTRCRRSHERWPGRWPPPRRGPATASSATNSSSGAWRGVRRCSSPSTSSLAGLVTGLPSAALRARRSSMNFSPSSDVVRRTASLSRGQVQAVLDLHRDLGLVVVGELDLVTEPTRTSATWTEWPDTRSPTSVNIAVSSTGPSTWPGRRAAARPAASADQHDRDPASASRPHPQRGCSAASRTCSPSDVEQPAAVVLARAAVGAPSRSRRAPIGRGRAAMWAGVAVGRRRPRRTVASTGRQSDGTPSWPRSSSMQLGDQRGEVVAQVDGAAGRVVGADRGPCRGAAAGVEELARPTTRLASMIAAASVRVWMSVAQVRGVVADQLEAVARQVGQPAHEPLDAARSSASTWLASRERVEHLAQLLLAGDQGGGEPVEAVDDAAEGVVLLGERGHELGERAEGVVEGGAVALEVLARGSSRAGRGPSGRGCRGTSSGRPAPRRAPPG